MKINRDRAISISGAIAAKAFEHIVEPARAAVESIEDEALVLCQAQLKDVVEKLPEAMAIGLIKEKTHIHVMLGGKSFDRGVRYWEDDEDKKSAPKYLVRADSGVVINDDALASRYKEAVANFEQMVGAMKEMAREIARQISGKNDKTVATLWPEAEGLIMGKPTYKDVTTPLDALIGKYLQPFVALPAPQDGTTTTTTTKEQ